jgi:hypothetical protein
MLIWLRPRRFASYSAASVHADHRALLSPACQPATPIDSVIRSMTSGWPRTTSCRGARSSHTRVAIPTVIVRAGPWQQEPELVSAQTGDQAVAPDIGQEDVGYDAQDLVEDVEPVGVVDPLEIIDIGHHKVRG